MGPFQTAIGQALGAIGGAALVAKNINEEKTKEQTAEEKGNEKAEKKEDKVISNEPVISAKAVKTAQNRKIDSPTSVYFWGDQPLATSSEMATVLSTQALFNATSSKKRSRDKVRERKQMLAKRALARK